MGQLTRGGLVAQALNEVGYGTTYVTLANIALNAALKRLYDAWPWPFLQRRRSGLALASGATSVVVGGGNGGITLPVRQIMDPIYLYNTDRSAAGRARIKQYNDAPFFRDEDVVNSSTYKGIPEFFKVRASTSTYGIWTLIPDPFPDRDLYLAFDYIEIPALIDTTSGGDSTVPLYPNDETLMCAVKAWALEHQRESALASSMRDLLASKAINDRITYGSGMGANIAPAIDPGVFR